MKCTFANPQKMDNGEDTWRIWINDLPHFAAHGFGPSSKINVFEEDNLLIARAGSMILFTHELSSNPSNLFLDLMLPKTWDIDDDSILKLTWNPGTISIELMPKLPEIGFRIQKFGELLSHIDFSKSSNSKFKKIHSGNIFSPASYMSALLQLEEDEIYIVGTSSKVTNLRKQLLQSTQLNHSVGIAIYYGEDEIEKTIDRYINDDSILDSFKDGLIFIIMNPEDHSDVHIQGISMNYGKRPVFKKIRQEIYCSERERDSVGHQSKQIVVWDMELIAASNILPNTQDLSSLSNSEIAAKLVELSNEIRIQRESV
ncbi:hypothetical protein N9K81_00215 [Candidatus Poseidoniales archaeon]|nr:hypothetical protein [Candidatus Poseidoniales archaeon]